jgi:hypothetical protein
MQLVPLIFVLAQAANPPPILTTYTEIEPSNKVSPPKGLISFLLSDSDVDDKRLFKECMTNAGLESDSESKLFSVYKVNGPDDRHPDYLVRPALTPYCFAFYGAHLFRFWFVATDQNSNPQPYRILLKGPADVVSVLSSTTKSHHDLLVGNNTAVEEFDSVMVFNGSSYTEKKCTKTIYKNGGVRETGLPCANE